ncbi:glycosyltransferase [Flavobacterium sp. ACAM 123]|uniref:glycosyltransferase n=1 Tax=Flavobacterium sp. ACAM 123 TaxID=1189620 RepID=UPI00031F5A73|nr:glycosyltransferase [Flavobacterium sp. ACAM 123]
MKPIKVCFLIPSLKSGGIETYLLRFLKHQKDNLNATVLIRNYEKGELYEAYKATGATLVFKPLGYFNPAAMYWYYQFFKAQKFDTVCDFSANFAGLPMVLSKMAGVKKRITFYRQGSDLFKKSVGKQLYNNVMNILVYSYSTAIFANSKVGLDFFFPKKRPNDTRFKVIKNGVNSADYLNYKESKKEVRKRLELPESAYIVGHTGRFTEAKNHFFLLNVVSLLMKQEANIHLVLIGNDTYQLAPHLKQLGIQDKCTVLGYQANIPEYLNAFDLYFFPSITEGQPNALIEAMISGLPIAASNIDAIKECLPTNNQNSLFDPYNVETTVQKTLEIIKNPQNYAYQEFAKQNFDAAIQFEEFFKNL